MATITALNAVNLAEMADTNMKEEQLVEIYIDAAIQLRSTLPTNLQFLAVSIKYGTLKMAFLIFAPAIPTKAL